MSKGDCQLSTAQQRRKRERCESLFKSLRRTRGSPEQSTGLSSQVTRQNHLLGAVITIYTLRYCLIRCEDLACSDLESSVLESTSCEYVQDFGELVKEQSEEFSL